MDPDAALDEAIKADNACFRAARRPGVTLGIHLCRGNNRSHWYAEGGYDAIAEKMFTTLDADRFLLEYDDARSGTFEPLRFIPKGKPSSSASSVPKSRKWKILMCSSNASTKLQNSSPWKISRSARNAASLPPPKAISSLKTASGPSSSLLWTRPAASGVETRCGSVTQLLPPDFPRFCCQRFRTRWVVGTRRSAYWVKTMNLRAW